MNDEILKIKELKTKTGFGILECKEALKACDWDLDKALTYIKEQSQESNKPVETGSVFGYVHHNQKLGVLLVLQCATDFVAKNEDFQTFGNQLAMHIAALDPKNVEELLSQPSLREEGTIGEQMKFMSGKFNEPIKVFKFQRFCLN
jgi:elongation factor Ts